ncbi:MAG: universal stress protein [Thermoanaerobaculia bacterium]
MTQIRRILCGSDLSEGADEAVRQAGILARGYGAALEVLHVIPNPLATDPALAQLVHPDRARAALDAARENARKNLTLRVASLTKGAPKEPTVHVEEGVPYAAIVSRAAEIEADLVVIGGKGAAGLKMQRLGEVAEKVVRHAQGSVLVARSSPASGNVLAATDLSDRSLPAVTSAAEEARRRGARLTVAHVVDPEKAMGSEVVATVLSLFSDDFMSGLGRIAKVRLADALERLGVKGDAVIENGAAGASILRLAEDLPAELVVIGNAGSTNLASVLVGSVAESVVRWAPCSVLVVRRRG